MSNDVTHLFDWYWWNVCWMGGTGKSRSRQSIRIHSIRFIQRSQRSTCLVKSKSKIMTRTIKQNIITPRMLIESVFFLPCNLKWDIYLEHEGFFNDLKYSIDILKHTLLIFSYDNRDNANEFSSFSNVLISHDQTLNVTNKKNCFTILF